MSRALGTRRKGNVARQAPSPPAAPAPPPTSPEPLGEGMAAPALNRGDWLLALILGLVVLAMILATRPFAGVPMNDDFSYARSAKALADTGRVAYNGWGSPLLWPQLVYGALVIKLWGFSYGALAATGIVMAVLATGAMFLLARACGCPPWLSVLATAVLTLNPIFLGVAPSFMSDVPSLFLLLIALLVLVRALRSENDDGGLTLAPRPFVVAVLLGIIAGSNRQVSWVAFLGALLPLFVLVPRARRLTGVGALAVLAAAGAMTLWFNRQPYTVPADVGTGLQFLLLLPNVAFLFIYKFLNMMGLFLVPLVLLAAWRRRWRFLLLAALLFFCFLPAFYAFNTKNIVLLGKDYRLTAYGQYFTSTGVVVGGVHGFPHRPILFSRTVIATLVLTGALSLALALYLLLDGYERAGQARRAGRVTLPVVAVTTVVTASVLQITASVPWFAQLNIFDRYLLFQLPGFLILLAAQAAANRPPRAIVGVAVALIAGMAVVAYGFVAEYMNSAAARARLYRDLRAQGVPARAIDAGFELNSDTQVAIAGTMNNPQIANPPGAFRPDARAPRVQYSPQHVPALDPSFLLSTETQPDSGLVFPDPVASATYASPLFPPHRRTIYVYRFRRPDAGE